MSGSLTAQPSEYLGRLYGTTTLSTSRNNKSSFGIIDETYRYRVRFCFPCSHPPDVFIQAPAFGLLDAKFIDGSCEGEIDGVEDSALACTIMSVQHSEAP